MIDPKKKIRQVLFSIYPLSYRIKITEPDKHFMDKKLFISVVQSLKQIEERQFFTVIENLMKMHFNKEQLALIQMYLYQLVPDKEWDGTITIEKNKQDKVVPFKLPEDVWNVVNSFT